MGTLYQVFKDTCDALFSVLYLPELPESETALQQSVEVFTVSRKPGSPLPGCVGALDGISIKIRKPEADLIPAAYWCRKHYYAILVQAIVDANYRFLCLSARCVGSTDDSLAHAISSLVEYLKAGLLHYAFWIAGDEAYICTEYLIKPFPASKATYWQDSFNIWHSSLRMHSEQAFGMLMAKWRMLRDLSFTVETNIHIVLIAMKLHNFVIDEEEIPKTIPSIETFDRVAL